MDSIDSDMVMVNSVRSCSGGNYEEYQRPVLTSIASDDSAVSVVCKNGYPLSIGEHEFTSMPPVREGDGPPLEQRDDIVEAKRIPSRLKEILYFNDEVKLHEVEEQMKARENIDRDMENNIEKIKKMEANEELKDAVLLESASVTLEKVTKVREVAKLGKTTLKRAMEIIEVALPPFLISCDKSFERNDLSEEVEKESELYDQCLMEKKKAAYDLEVGEQKSVESKEHLSKCIEFAKKDESRISDKQRIEIEEGRVKKFTDAKNEMDDIIKSELDDVRSCLKSCKGDLQNIQIIQGEQSQRFKSASKNYDNCVKTIDAKLSINRQNQNDLRKKLENLEQQERSLLHKRKFEEQTQQRSAEWNANINEQLTELVTSISNIQVCATTSLKVMELMKEAGSNLLNSSIKAEEQYLNHLRDLDIESKTRWRRALATSAIDCRLVIDNASTNIDEYKETYKGLKGELNKAVQKQQRLNVEKLKNQLKEYKEEMKQEEKKKKQAEDELNKLMEFIVECDEQLVQLGRSVHSVDELYEWRKQEMSAYPSGDYSSIEPSEDEASDNEE